MRRKGTVRFTVDLSAAANTKLEELAERVGATTKAEVFRDALRLYEWAVEVYADGSDFFTQAPGGELEKVVILGAQPLSPTKPLRAVAGQRAVR